MLVEPGINHVWRNVFYRCGPMATGSHATLDLIENGVFSDTTPASQCRQGRLPSQARRRAVRDGRLPPHPDGDIGLYQDTYRASWPVVTTPEAVPEWRPERRQ